MRWPFFTRIFIRVFLILSIFLLISGCEKQNFVCFKENCFEVELAETYDEYIKGLMFKESLDRDKGMLFIFDKEKNVGFWMKDTSIPLDIIWINKDKKVVHIAKNMLPCEQDPCYVVTPDEKAMYVLEINANLTEEMNLSVGDSLIFDIS